MSMSEPTADVLAVIDAAHGSFDNLRHERRGDAIQDQLWSRRIAELLKARAAVVALIEALQHARRVMASGVDPQQAIDAADEALRKAGVR